MNTLSYKTISGNKATANKAWLVVDAENEVLGRLAAKVSKLLRGKYKPNFTPHADCGDNVIIINADKIRLTGHKWEQKTYLHHTGYPGGQRFVPVKQILANKPTEIVRHAVKGMLPKNKLSNAVINNLYIYTEAEHKHEAQQPKKIDLNQIM